MFKTGSGVDGTSIQFSGRRKELKASHYTILPISEVKGSDSDCGNETLFFIVRQNLENFKKKCEEVELIDDHDRKHEINSKHTPIAV